VPYPRLPLVVVTGHQGRRPVHLFDPKGVSSTMSKTSLMKQPKKIPAKINQDINFFEHQIDGIRQLARMSSFLLADEMGLGKTLQSLTVAALDFEEGWAKRILIVTPAGLKFNWLEDITKFTSFDAMVLDGPPKKREKMLQEFEDNGMDALILNYELIDKHTDRLKELAFDIVICDEAHMTKNPRAKRSKSVHKLEAKRFFMLTGSPVLNRADELWSILHRIDPEAFPNYWKFLNRFCLFGGFNKKQVIGVKRPAELKALVDQVMVRRLKMDCLDLPEKQRITVNVDLNPGQLRIYKKVRDDLLLELPDDPDPMEIETGIVKFMRLAQVSSTPANVGLEDDSAKLDMAVEKIKELYANGNKCVVFTRFRGTLAALADRLAAESIVMPVIHGDVAKKRRHDIASEWTATAEPQPLGLMLQVGGIGLNLTAARHVIFVDKDFVPKLNEQAEDRCHRIGASETHPVQIIDIIARGTIDQRVNEILTKKDELFNTLINPTDWKKTLYKALKDEINE